MSERELSSTEHQIVRNNCQGALGFLDLTQSSSSESIITAINEFVQGWQNERRTFWGKLLKPRSPATKLAEILGSLWGKVIYDELGWGWFVYVEDNEDHLAVGNTERSMVIYPMDFVRNCLTQPWADCTIELSYSMLREGMKPEDLVTGSYESIIGRIAHIIPP